MRFSLLFLMVYVVVAFSSRVSFWSESFPLQKVVNTVAEGIDNKSDRFDFWASPNPFNPTTTFYVSGIMRNVKSELKIYTIEGKQIADLSNYLRSGVSILPWVPVGSVSGVYVARLISAGYQKTIKLIVLK